MRAGLVPLISLLVFTAACSRADGDMAPNPSPSRDSAGGPGARSYSAEGLTYRAETAVLESFPVQLATTVKVQNTTRQPITLTFPDGCPVLLRAYRTSDRVGAPAWDQARETICTMAIQEFEIKAGDTLELHRRASAAEILGDSLPNGRYWLTAVVRRMGGPIELAAGEVELAR
jgi:hypothetical protein